MSLEKRLERLERQNRRFKQGIVLAVVLAASALLAGAAGRLPRNIATHQLTIVDSQEKNGLAGIRVGKDGLPSIFLLDSAGTYRSMLSVFRSGAASIDFRDRNGKVRLSMGVFRGSPRINFISAAGKLTRTIR